jgi:hypothetical protein
MRLPLSVVIAALLVPLASAQNPSLLIDDPVMKWNVAKNGPMLVVEPERTVAIQEGSGWPAFGRKRVTIRGLTAIVPTQMTLVMEDPPEGNLVDGLPRQAKVIYLLTKLTPAQVRTISTRGIGREDLSGEARAVFDSILPNPFGWTRYHVGPNRQVQMRVQERDKGVLSDADRAKVRLRVQQRITLYGTPMGRESGRSAFATHREATAKGEFGYRRDESAERQRAEHFGVPLRTVVENRLKPSQLAYRDRAYDAVVGVPANATIAELLKLIRAATGKEILSDLRVSDRRVTFFGSQARAGDLLEALAFAVTGTYRRIQDSYVLTSDLIGMGTRYARLGLWVNELNHKTREWQDTLMASLAERDIQSFVTFDADSPLSPPPAVQDRIRSMREGFESEPFDPSELGPELHSFFKRSTERYPASRAIDATKVRVGSTLVFSFVLPNGAALLDETTPLGDASNFRVGHRIVRQRPLIVPEQVLPLGDKYRLIAKAATAAEAKTAAEFAKRRGFGELWLETESADALRAGMEGGLPVRLALRPWRTAKASGEVDQTLLGDTGPALAKRSAASGGWQSYLQNVPEARLTADHRLVPGSAAQRAAWEAYERLMKTPGLAGSVLLDPVSMGYQTSRVGSVAMAREFQEMIGFGYSPSLRLRFLREKGIDPIDTASPLPSLTANLQQPFFLDHVQGGPTVGMYMYDAPPRAMGSARVEWDQFRADLAKAALEDLYPRLAPASLLVPSNQRGLIPYDSTRPTPDIRWVTLPDPAQDGLLATTISALKGDRSGNPVAVDATGIPVKRLEEALDKWKIGS